ncbi:unnamed protein product [Schistosoma intercalatum]|nr:unnamed protein product [Schistosoma intercalatum]CAH8606017.1 unnamed protein product [Schistosoma intercalatum]
MSHSPGDKVFAKIKGFPNWPARVNPLPHDVQIPKGKLPIFFYGTYQVSFVSVKNIVPYEKFKDKWGKPKPSAQFMTAMKEIEANPGIYMLGEDPRAEKFLHQFYDFKPMGSECVRQYKRQHPRKSKVDSDQPLSTTNQGTSSSGDQINRVSDDTSSEISTDQSRVNSLDPAPEDSNDEETLIDNTNHHMQINNYQQMDISCSERLSPSSAIDRPSDEKDSYQENREARRLARKMQKKAEKKALKKAAKREAKRLAKEKRAERRARREAKRELKRLHKLEKSRLTEQGNLNFDVQESNTRNPDVNQESSSNHAWDDNQWSPASHSEPVQTNDSTDSSSNRPILPTLDDRCASPLQFMHQPDDDSIFSTHQNDYSSSNGELLTKEINFSNTTPLEYDKHQYSTGSKRTGILFHSNGSDNESSQLLNGGTIKLENSEIPPKKKAKTVFMKNNDDDDDIDDENTVCHPEMKIMSSSKSNSHHSQTNNEKDVKQSAAVIEAADSLVVEASDNSKPTVPEPLPEAVTKHGVVTTATSNNNKKRNKSVQQRSRLRKKKPNAILLDSDEDEMNSEKKVINLRDSSPSSLSSPSPLSLSNDSDIENSKSKDQLSSQLKEKSRNSSPKPSTINKSNRARKSRNQKSNQKTNNNNLKVKRKQTEVKPTAASNTSVQDEKRISNDSSGIRQAAASNDPVTQLNQCCRDLKTSLIKGHENFAEAVQLLNKVRSIPVRLPQLAEAWDLMDCIKKCRRYKLSSEVREAAQTTFQFFQSLQANTTKEELSQAQALIASHQNRIHSVQDSVMENTSKTDSLSISADVDNKQTLQNNTNSNNSSESTSDNTTTTTTTNTTTTITIEPENLTADLEAKVDDVLSRIRATEERMAAAAVSSTRSDTPYKSISNHVTNSSIRSTGGRIIRASAVAAATAHMHDEEDEESVMSRVEQVAAYEASAINYPNPASLGSPPPPPPPPPSLSFGSVGPSDQLEAKASPSVDHLDLDSRIQLFMSAASSQKSAKLSNSKPVVTASKSEMTPTTRSHHIQPNLTSVTSSTSSASTLSSTVALSSSSSLLPVLLAKRKVIADKLAAVKASGSPIKSCHPVTSPLPSPTSINNEFNIVEKVSSSVTTTPASTTTTATTIHTPPLLTKMSNTAKMPSKDEELYDLLDIC